MAEGFLYSSVTSFGHATISICGNNTSGSSAIKLLNKNGCFRNSEIFGQGSDVKKLLLSEEYGLHKTDKGRMYKLAVIPMSEVHEEYRGNTRRTFARLQEYCERQYPGSLKATEYTASLSVSLRMFLSDPLIKDYYKMTCFTIFHKPLHNQQKNPVVLRVSSCFDGGRLVYSHARPFDEFDVGGALLIVVP